MKKNFKYALLGAIALTGAVSFSACSSNEDIAEVNPTYDGTSVRTDFAFSVTKASSGQTRQGATAVQLNGQTFRGMSGMYLFPFDNVPAFNKTTNAVNYYLGDLTTSDISSTADRTSTTSSKVYSLTIPVGTNNFLFYGTATRSAETNAAVGRLTNSLSTNIDNTKDIFFSLANISTVSDFNTDANKIAQYLTYIAQTPDWAGSVTQASSEGSYRALALLYEKFTTTNEDRSGSAESIKRMILDLYKSAKAINQESSVSAIKTIAEAICNRIDDAGNACDVKITIDATTNPTDPDKWTATCTGFNSEFPSNLGLPMGAAQLVFSNNAFAYKTSPNYSVGVTPATTSVHVENICYPAEIVYFDNSPIRATDTYHKADEYPISAANWDADADDATGHFSSDWKDGNDVAVSSTTRAVAMKNNVNYGVAMLSADVILLSDQLKDNMQAIVGGSAEDQTIKAKAAKNLDEKETVFTVSGILIGGQPNQVGWNMVKPSDNATTTSFSSVIYDSDITFKTTPLSTNVTSANYTVVLDNYDAAKNDNAQSEVLIALQIINDGVDFYGKNGLIPAGSTFYLVGSLSPTTFTRATRLASYRITKEEVDRVFIQDYMTTAHIKISADALKGAYSVIPDLRSTEVVFGLSVDLNWETGMETNVDM